MQDDEIKKIIQNDHSAPEKKGDEWATLVKGIEKTDSQKGFTPFSLSYAFAFSFVLLVVGGQLLNTKNAPSITDDVLAQYIMEDDYFQQEEVLYSWIDE